MATVRLYRSKEERRLLMEKDVREQNTFYVCLEFYFKKLNTCC